MFRNGFSENNIWILEGRSCKLVGKLEHITEQYYLDCIKENEMGEEFSTHGREGKEKQNCRRKTPKESFRRRSGREKENIKRVLMK
jgi:hypothetical protein